MAQALATVYIFLHALRQKHFDLCLGKEQELCMARSYYYYKLYLNISLMLLQRD